LSLPILPIRQDQIILIFDEFSQRIFWLEQSLQFGCSLRVSTSNQLIRPTKN